MHLSKPSPEPENNLDPHCSSPRARGVSAPKPTAPLLQAVLPGAALPARGAGPARTSGALAASTREALQLAQATGAPRKGHPGLTELAVGQRRGLDTARTQGSSGNRGRGAAAGPEQAGRTDGMQPRPALAPRSLCSTRTSQGECIWLAWRPGLCMRVAGGVGQRVTDPRSGPRENRHLLQPAAGTPVAGPF